MAKSLGRRRVLRLGSLLAAGLAGCTAPVADSRSTTPGSDAFDPATRRAARAVGLRARPAVVVLQPVDGATSGTAWFLEGGHLVTNAHVLDELPGEAIEARTIDGRTADVAVARRRATPDLALLSAGIEPPATLQPGDSSCLTAGQPLVQIGHVRLGYWTVSIGRFRRRVDLDGRQWLLSDLPTMRGNSGSPVLTLDGEVVGMTFGSVPKRGTNPDEAPTPGSTAVYASYPRDQIEHAGHLAIETVLEHLELWTESTGD